MPYQLYGRICVGAPLAPRTAEELHAEFVASLGLASGADAASIFEQLRADTQKHKLHEPDVVRYERALEAFIDARWDVDFAVGGLAPDAIFEPRKGFLFVGVRVEQFELEVAELPRHASAPDRVQWLAKGDLTRGSDLAKQLGPAVRKPFEHACTAYSRAAREVLADATKRVKDLPISKQHEPAWALCRWVVDASHAATHHRHGRAR